MYRCEKCQTITQPRQPENRMVTEWRDVTYTFPEYHKGKPTKKMITKGGQEIVREIRLCPECYVLLTGMEPAKKPEPRKEEPKHRTKRPSYKKRKWRNPRAKKQNRGKPQVEKVNPLKVVKE